MSPEEYAALLATGKVNLIRDTDENFIYVATATRTAVLPRDIIQQLEQQRQEAISQHTARLAAFDAFISALKAAK